MLLNCCTYLQRYLRKSHQSLQDIKRCHQDLHHKQKFLPHCRHCLVGKAPRCTVGRHQAMRLHHLPNNPLHSRMLCPHRLLGLDVTMALHRCRLSQVVLDRPRLAIKQTRPIVVFRHPKGFHRSNLARIESKLVGLCRALRGILNQL